MSKEPIRYEKLEDTSTNTVEDDFMEIVGRIADEHDDTLRKLAD